MVSKYLYYLIILFFILIFSYPLFSQVGFNISPLSFDLEIFPGEKIDFEIALFNETDRSVTYYSRITDAIQSDNGQYLPIDWDSTEDGNKQISHFSCSKWIELESEELNFSPWERKIIKGSIHIPQRVPYGSYSALINFDLYRRDQTPKIEEGVQVSISTGTVIFLNVKKRGVIQSKAGKYGVIENFEVKNYDKFKVFTASFKNLGKYFIDGQGKLQIFREDNKKVYDGALGQGRGRVLPGQKVDFITYINPPFPSGNYRAKAIISYGGNKSAEAEISFVNYDNQIVLGEKNLENAESIGEFLTITANKELENLKIIPKSTRTVNISLRNDSKELVTFDVKVNNVSNLASTHFKDNIEVTPEHFEIAPYHSKNVKVVVRCPENISDGNKYVDVKFIPITYGKEKISENLQEVYSNSVFLLLSNVKGEKIEKASVLDVDIQLEETETEYFPNIKVHFYNEGNIHIKPVLSVTINEKKIESSGEDVLVSSKDNKGITLGTEPSDEIALPGMDGEISLRFKSLKKDNALYNVTVTLINSEDNVELLKENYDLQIKEDL
jgi:P pilus assembly chaperone PapD